MPRCVKWIPAPPSALPLPFPAGSPPRILPHQFDSPLSLAARALEELAADASAWVNCADMPNHFPPSMMVSKNSSRAQTLNQLKGTKKVKLRVLPQQWRRLHGGWVDLKH